MGEAFSYAFAATQHSDAFLATQARQDNPALLLG